MPTGYTTKLYNGVPQTFPEFALHCARAFGALIHMKEDDLEAPIRPGKVDGYAKEHVRKATDKKLWLLGLTPEQCEAEADRQYKKAVKDYNNVKKDREELKTRYLQMLAQVVAWEPPTTEHVGLKNFMVEQLTSSIEGDCGMKYFPVPVQMTGEEWLESQLESADHDIEYFSKEDKEEQERVADRNEWVEQLKNSLR